MPVSVNRRRHQTHTHADQRRAVVLGSSGSASTALERAERQATAETRTTVTATRTRSSRAKSRSGFGRVGGPSLNGVHTSAIFAEYILGVVIISLGIFVKGGSQGYQVVMSNVMMRLTALTAVFFVLFLMAGSKRGGQAAVWFGLLVDLGVVFTAARSQTLTTTADIIAGKGTGVDTATLTSSTNATEPQRVQLPDE